MARCMLKNLLFLCFVVGTLLHGGQTVSCFHCDGNNFPSCLNHHQTCHHNHVCEVIYGVGHPVQLKCKPAPECRHAINHGSGYCGFHGVHTHHGCEICCRDASCVNAQVDYLKGLNTVAASTSTASPSTASMTVSMTTDLTGTGGMTTGATVTGRVATGAFTTNTVATGAVTTDTVAMSTNGMTPGATITVSPMTTPHHLNPLLNGNCADLMQNNGCSALGTSVCKTDVGVRVCADTCGLCALIHSRFTNKTVCEDKLLNNECAILKQTNDICSNQLAHITCPRTCGICGSILDKLVMEILHPTTTVSTTTTTHAICIDTLQGMDCSQLNNVCANPLGPQICKKYCGICT